MGCRTCCCCSPRAGARLVGLIDVIAGLLGIAIVGFLLVDVRREEQTNEMKATVTTVEDGQYDSYETLWTLAVALIFPSVLNIIVGITTLIAVSMNNIIVGRLAYVLTIVLIISSLAIYVICFILGIHWIEPMPLLLWGFLQIVFVCAIQDFIKLELSIESV
ncbi:unnamed protein product [Allacma fusca]|uniref:Uncharacterized protein n=1 Tax=Allacma fusca TaxID=39272 RepID=A0A8J2KS03_9HEXA|nr:unnamed protein product [Allacma fusca]